MNKSNVMSMLIKYGKFDSVGNKRLLTKDIIRELHRFGSKAKKKKYT